MASTAKRFPDMWLDPEDDPREAGDQASGEKGVLTDYLDAPWDSYRRRRFVHDVVRVAGLFAQMLRQEESTLLPLYMPPGQYRYIDGINPLL